MHALTIVRLPSVGSMTPLLELNFRRRGWLLPFERWSVANRALLVPAPGNPGAWLAGSCGSSPALPATAQARAAGDRAVKMHGVVIFFRHPEGTQQVRLYRSLAYIGTRLRELEMIPYMVQTYA